MLLAVDIGNTHIVLGLFDGEALRRSWRLWSRPGLTSDELRVLLAGLLGDDATAVRDGIVGSVVPPLTGEVRRALVELTGVEPIEVAPGVRTGLRIRTDNPHELGADRILNAVAALERYGGPCIVVDLGTATTLDVVTAEGEYLGGVIAAGPEISAAALAERTARLARVDLKLPPHVIGRNTVDSIRSGLLHGHAAMIEGLVTRVERELGGRATVVTTGGLGALIGRLLERVDVHDPHLTLHGLRIVHARNRAR
ncbi:MAG: type III pantothenate kinase [Acidobacteria bacterium]|nr:MAG: type III pantothenate kinase [Acidobacteriota bacterium]